MRQKQCSTYKTYYYYYQSDQTQENIGLYGNVRACVKFYVTKESEKAEVAQNLPTFHGCDDIFQLKNLLQ